MTKQPAEGAIVKTGDLPALPDFLGTAQRVQTVANILADAQQQLQSFQALQVINGHALDDKVPVPSPGEDTPTYRERFGQLKAGMAALMEQSADIADELAAEALKRRRARERELEGGQPAPAR